MYNKLLLRQIQKNFGGVDDIPENLVALFNVISNSYDHYEKDRSMIERSIELSSKEMIELNNNLRNEIKEIEKANIRILSTTKIPFTASGTDIPAVLGVSIDITESKKAEETTLLLSDMISNTSEAIIIRHPSTDKIIFWNDGAEKLYGYEENEIIGVSTHEILQTRFPSSFKTIMDTFYKEEHWNGEVIHTNKNGRKIHVETSWTLRRNAAGMAMGFLEINRDITEK